MKKYQKLAEIFEYPDCNFHKRLDDIYCEFKTNQAECINEFDNFKTFVNNKNSCELQEYYTHTFDLDPIATLNLSYHVFGETHKRGTFLARLKEELFSNDVSIQELPDHLPIILKQLTRLNDRNYVLDLVEYIILPALNEIKKALILSNNAYKDLIEILIKILKKDFNIKEIKKIPINNEKFCGVNYE